MKHITCIGILLLLFISVNGQKADSKRLKGWAAVYSNNEKGEPTQGNIQDLINGLRKGYSVKVGWSWSRKIGDSTITLEHFAEPIFLSILQESHVSMVINPHPLLKNYIDINKQEFDNPNHIWQCVLTTQGTFNAIVYKQATGEMVNNWPQRHKMTWYLEYP